MFVPFGSFVKFPAYITPLLLTAATVIAVCFADHGVAGPDGL